jgi:hypothetical protein
MPLKQTLLGKAAPEPNLPEHPPLVLPPRDAALPVPGTGQAAAPANPQWPTNTDPAKNQAAASNNASCNGDGGQDCRPGWFSRTFGSGDDKKTQ